MSIVRVVLVAWFGLAAVPGAAQSDDGVGREIRDSSDTAEAATEAEGETPDEAAPGDAEEEEEIDIEAGVSGDYGQEEEDDDFVPTQEVSSDQSVRFPVDI